MEKIIAQDSLIGQALADDLEECYRAAECGEGYDYLDLDYQLQQHDDFEEEVQFSAAIVAVYASEVRRFA